MIQVVEHEQTHPLREHDGIARAGVIPTQCTEKCINERKTYESHARGPIRFQLTRRLGGHLRERAQHTQFRRGRGDAVRSSRSHAMNRRREHARIDSQAQTRRALFTHERERGVGAVHDGLARDDPGLAITLLDTKRADLLDGEEE